MNKADRIAREHLRSQQEAASAEEDRRTSDAASRARIQIESILSLSREVVGLLEAGQYNDPRPEALSLSVFRFPPLGDLFGYRKIVKGGWKIAEWKYDREKPGHTVWLLADGRYCWNSQIVTLSQFTDWHESRYVSQGPPLMEQGLLELKIRVETGLRESKAR